MPVPLETPSGAPLAALYLGRIQSAVRAAPEESLRILAARVIRESLIAALRQEGHAFTEQRFHEWFAGLKTLSDLPRHRLRPPRAICQAILTELLHSSWSELAGAAEKLQHAFLAPADFPSDYSSSAEHQDIHSIIEDARKLLAGIAANSDDLPFTAINALYAEVRDSPRFGPQERALGVLDNGFGSVAFESDTPVSSRWALDLLAGTKLATDWCSPLGRLPLPTPLPGLIQLAAAIIPDNDLWDAKQALCEEGTNALRDALWKFDQWLCEAERQARTIAERSPGRRSTGRSGPVLEVLAGFGAMRSRQIELVVGASRLGVRSILETIRDAGLLAVETAHNRTLLYRYTERDMSSAEPEQAESGFAFSQQSLDEFEASMKAIDDLLNKGPLATGD